MNQDNDNSSTTDDRLSAAYRAIATESAPHRLNHAVLKQAKAALKSSRSQRWPLPLLRPLAFAATVGISLAIVLQLGDTFVDTSSDPTDSVHQEPPGARSGGPASEKREPVQAGGIANTGRLRQDRPQPEAATTMPDDAVDSDNSRSPAVSMDLNAAAERAAVPPAIPGDSLVRESSRYCDDEQSASAARWLACIEDLQQAGRTEDAGHERRLLLRAFPGADATDPN